MNAPLPRWAARLLTREDGTALALFRIGVGLSVLVSLGGVIAHHDVAPLWFDVAHAGWTGTNPNWFFKLIGGADPLRVELVLAATLVAAVALVLGVGGRIPALVALIGHPALVHLQSDGGGSYDSLLGNALWLLVLGEATATLSLDLWLRERRWASARMVPAWPRWLALYQLVLVYFTTGLQKLSDTWVPGGELSAIYYVLQQPTWQRFDMRALAHAFPLTQAATLAVWCFEVGSPLLLLALYFERRGRGWIGRWLARLPIRRSFAAFGFAMHTGIAVTMVLGCFSVLVLSFYAALLRPSATSAPC